MPKNVTFAYIVNYIMDNLGFVRVAAATPEIRVADSDFNTDNIIKLISEAESFGVAAMVFPEMCITGYTCGDLFHNETLLKGVEQSVMRLLDFLRSKSIIVIVNIPMTVAPSLYDVSLVLYNGLIVGAVPKIYLPNYNEFYEMRWFASGTGLSERMIHFAGQEFLISNNLIFETPFMRFGLEICEDLWTPIPPSCNLSLMGADVIFNSSASNETVGKHAYRRSLVAQQSARCMSGYVYTSSGITESSTDLVFSGSRLIAENGSVISESPLFESGNKLTFADLDIDRLRRDRIHNSSFTASLPGRIAGEVRTIYIDSKQIVTDNIERYISFTPFVPSDGDSLNERCYEIFSIQTSGLAKRMKHAGIPAAVIGISGGLDSTLALLVVAKTADLLSIPREQIVGITMPGFGTTDRTYGNAIELMKALGITIKEIPISDAVNLHFRDIEQDPHKHDITYENSQARERTQILMDYANKVNGLVIGTGDLSELALGWCTYNGDHMSMYAVNTGVPKTLVRRLVQWVAETQVSEAVRNILLDIIDTPVSPELLPADINGNISQMTEDVVGPYVLHDFFLYYVLRFGFGPSKIFFLARHAFAGQFDDEVILKWLRIFFRRFFSQQFKRSCMPDGPKVGSVNLSPRGDWRMPSDASVALWLKELDKISLKN